MIKNEMKDREQTQQALRPAQVAPVRRANSVDASRQAEAVGIEASWELINHTGTRTPFAGDDAE